MQTQAIGNLHIGGQARLTTNLNNGPQQGAVGRITDLKPSATDPQNAVMQFGSESKSYTVPVASIEATDGYAGNDAGAKEEWAKRQT